MITAVALTGYEISKIVRDASIYSDFPAYEPVQALLKRYDSLPEVTAPCSGGCGEGTARTVEAEDIMRNVIFSFVQITQTFNMEQREKFRKRYRTNQVIIHYRNPLTGNLENFKI